MTREEESRLEALDRIVRTEVVRQRVSPVITRVCAELAQKPEALMTWEPIPLDVFGGELPKEIRSGWIFVLRAGADTGAERHPNSHQRMMSFQGGGDMRTAGSGATGSDWKSNVLTSQLGAPLEQRWISIPPNVWHRPVVNNDANWIVISFHTVSAKELIEERPGGAAERPKQMKYLDPH